MKRIHLPCSILILALLFTACRGKEGDRGPIGAGGTETTYTVTIPADTDTVNHLAEFDINAPALTDNSSVTVYISSMSTNWQNYGFAMSLNLNSKTIHIVTNFSSTPNEHEGWSCKALVHNPG
jgi:hypothetical protein